MNILARSRLARGVLREWQDVLNVAAGINVKAAVLGRRVLDRGPGSDEGVALGSDIEIVLVIGIALRAWGTEEELALQCADLAANEAFGDLEDLSLAR
jgi:hypothetical protein